MAPPDEPAPPGAAKRTIEMTIVAQDPEGRVPTAPS